METMYIVYRRDKDEYICILKASARTYVLRVCVARRSVRVSERFI